ncbi:hypothetical protein DIT71_13915 [Marinobacter vulgaris]|uniref:Fibronectin type-III domain-containing protein n=1 Tax=Marinobacter vulgaris TaxID=1928331 RepID=A0A2V3ZID9_9GAMM|nr:fibronectin type III domain-containing protein [Marinobacter vulgaris]PXX89860.1 hypothetical protein DIT71_13915 [Marinobacter vulgaris]TSJ68603.1 fibronectin type III domain-containing protein [Marinobacter vulgaris]
MGSEDSSTAAQSQSTNEPTVAIAGAAMKGVIQQGLVTANRLISDKDGYYAPHRQAAKPVLTADDGSYEWHLRGKADSWALVELQANDNTRMLCDVVPQCDQNGANPVAFGQPMALDSDFSLRGAGDLVTETINLTPLTHLAVALAERSADGFSPEALSASYGTVEGWFGLAAGSLRLPPPDLTRLEDADSVSADALQLAVANAAFLALVNDSARWDSISQVLNNVATQVTETGQISMMGDDTNVALADLIEVAAVQAAELQVTVDSSIVSQRLGLIKTRSVHHLKTIADVYEDSDTTVAETGETANDTTEDTSSDTTTDTVTDTTEDTTGSVEETAGTGGNTSGDTIADTDTGTGTDTSDTSTTETTEEVTIAANTALLSWTAPLTRENGVSLAMGEIAGFEVVYGTSAETLDQSIDIEDASVDKLLVEELTEGTWYFAIRTLDTDGNRSRLSEVVHKQI